MNVAGLINGSVARFRVSGNKGAEAIAPVFAAPQLQTMNAQLEQPYQHQPNPYQQPQAFQQPYVQPQQQYPPDMYNLPPQQVQYHQGVGQR